ncbi:DUF551 domain-containing protein [Kluyvera intermedia]|uniref:DUF551 domain-containing protein n=1 Tax=Kluyvera intermedia TaxID=61648 RepID=UPI0039F509DD
MIWKLERDGMTPKMLSLMRELREVRRAKGEPVAYMHHSGQVVTREECCDDKIFAICCKVETPLYAAPQPATVVPDEQHSERFGWTLGQWAEHVGGHHQGNDPANYYEFGSFMAVAAMLRQFGTVQQKLGWNACRAAMLQLSGNSEQLEPVGNRDELPPNSFTNEDLAGMAHGDSPQANAYRELLAFRRSSPATQDGWIPVSERMPDRDYVLAADISGAYYPPHLPNTQVGIYADWFGDGKPSWDDGDGNDLHLKQVTHWMPLPAAPKEEITQALSKGMERYGNAMQKLAKKEVG